MNSPDKILAVILGGGRGTRLHPLTQQRSKPAIPIAGKYRLIDISISNCINSGINHIGVLTQFNSVSLNRHIANSYKFDAFHPGWVQVWAAEQTIHTKDWYQGTADAVRKHLDEIRAAQTPYVLILASDHLYQMDYKKMLQFHKNNNADITVATHPVSFTEAPSLGILKYNPDFRITQFVEKPNRLEELGQLVCRSDPARPLLGSMGIYLFNTSVLIDLLESSQWDDFGNHIIPSAIATHRVVGYDFEGYWEDIGTIRSLYNANLALTSEKPPFNFFDPLWRIYTQARFLPGAVIENSTLDHVVLAEGSHIQDSFIRNSVIGLRSQIKEGCRIEDTVMMGADDYDTAYTCGEDNCDGEIPVGIGRQCKIKGAIIDKNARVGDQVVIQPFPRGTDLDEENWSVRDGIVIIPKNATILKGTIIQPKTSSRTHSIKAGTFQQVEFERI
ncbi:MAG: glucose-1-phosphate adenylyltransferase [Anaerolineaceae bacterium]|nr:glucose-1-phosphate adenylyltransferase [Anaerolineaceae bacterium]